MALRLIKGITQRDDPIATHMFENITKETEFLSTPHTRKWYKDEHTYPLMIDRDTYDTWVLLGKKSIAERATDEVGKLLSEPAESSLDENTQKELQDIMLADARNNGLDTLPKI